MGADCKQAQDPERAIRGCTAIIESGQWSGEALAAAYSYRGWSYGALGRQELALADFKKAIDVSPDSYFGYGNRAQIYSAQGQYDRVAADLSKALQLSPDHPMLLVQRARAY